jgi:hypothetical protein
MTYAMPVARVLQRNAAGFRQKSRKSRANVLRLRKIRANIEEDMTDEQIKALADENGLRHGLRIGVNVKHADIVRFARAILQATSAAPQIIEIESTPIHIDFETTAAKYRTDIVKALHKAGAPFCREDGELMSPAEQIEWLGEKAKCATPSSAAPVDPVRIIQELIDSHKRDTGGECDESCEIVEGMEAARDAIAAAPHQLK